MRVGYFSVDDAILSNALRCSPRPSILELHDVNVIQPSLRPLSNPSGPNRQYDGNHNQANTGLQGYEKDTPGSVDSIYRLPKLV